MKKLTVLLLVATLGMTMVACGKDTTGTAGNATSEETATETSADGATMEGTSEEEVASTEVTEESTTLDEEQTEATTEDATEEAGTEAAQDADMDAIAALLGMKDEETANLLNGGEENWTEDKSFYIGRIYQTSLNGSDIKVMTSVGEDVVEAVSIWLADGEQALDEATVQGWVDYFTAWIGAEPEYDDTSSEAGSKIWKWKWNETFVKIFQNGDVLTVTLNPAVGEMK